MCFVCCVLYVVYIVRCVLCVLYHMLCVLRVVCCVLCAAKCSGALLRWKTFVGQRFAEQPQKHFDAHVFQTRPRKCFAGNVGAELLEIL